MVECGDDSLVDVDMGVVENVVLCVCDSVETSRRSASASEIGRDDDLVSKVVVIVVSKFVVVLWNGVEFECVYRCEMKVVVLMILVLCWVEIFIFVSLDKLETMFVGGFDFDIFVDVVIIVFEYWYVKDENVFVVFEWFECLWVVFCFVVFAAFRSSVSFRAFECVFVVVCVIVVCDVCVMVCFEVLCEVFCVLV